MASTSLLKLAPRARQLVASGSCPRPPAIQTRRTFASSSQSYLQKPGPDRFRGEGLRRRREKQQQERSLEAIPESNNSSPSDPPSPPWPTTTTSGTSFPWSQYNVLPGEQVARPLTGPRQGAVRRGAEVIVPQDPEGVLDLALADGREYGARTLLEEPALVVVRQLEMMNLFLGFDQANRYAIMSPDGRTVGYLAEEDKGFVGVMTRQVLHTHRSFTCVIMNADGEVILRIRRPFQFINSRIFISTSDPNEVIGEVQQVWHPWRRKYDLFAKRGDGYDQFAKIDGGFLTWDFWLEGSDGKVMGSINRNFAGFGREIFTDTGQYALRFDAIAGELADEARGRPLGQAAFGGGSAPAHQGPPTLEPAGGLTLDQRAIILAAAVSIDFDYFTRSQRGGLLPFGMYGGGDDI